VTDCLTDDDCPAEDVCFCGEEVNLCLPADCKSDSDCADSTLCGTYYTDPCGADPDGVRCQTPEVCAEESCEVACGRPFLVEGVPRTANAVPDASWVDASLTSAVRVESLPGEVRRELAQRFTRLGLMEHASIAAFARFALELLAVAAPVELVTAALAAAEDERRHARLCFSLASAYGERPVGPGPLSLQGCAPVRDLARVAETTFLEGCIGETVAAIEARDLAHQVEDPVLADIFASIGEDESRHAALAWRFVNWALAQAPAEVCPIIERHLRELADVRFETVRNMDRAASARYGLLSAEQSSEIRSRALGEVVLPCASLLLEHGRGAQGPRQSLAGSHLPSAAL
jgi:hypothetical protein